MEDRVSKLKSSRYYSDGAKKELLRKYYESHEPKKVFCNKYGLATATLLSWIKQNDTKENDSLSTPSSCSKFANFIELGKVSDNAIIKVQNTTPKLATSHKIKLQLGKSITLELSWEEQ